MDDGDVFRPIVDLIEVEIRHLGRMAARSASA